VWADLETAVPDGICLDEEGAIWVASPSTRSSSGSREGGEVTDRIALPKGKGAYACMLGGEDRRPCSCVPARDGAGPGRGRSRAGSKRCAWTYRGPAYRRSGYAQQFHRGARDLQVQFRSARYGLISWPSPRGWRQPLTWPPRRASCVPAATDRPRRAQRGIAAERRAIARDQQSRSAEMFPFTRAMMSRPSDGLRGRSPVVTVWPRKAVPFWLRPL